MSRTLQAPISPADLPDLELDLPVLQALDRELCDELATIRAQQAATKALPTAERRAPEARDAFRRLMRRRQALNELREALAVELKVSRIRRQEQRELERNALFVVAARKFVDRSVLQAIWAEVDSLALAAAQN